MVILTDCPVVGVKEYVTKLADAVVVPLHTCVVPTSIFMGYVLVAPLYIINRTCEMDAAALRLNWIHALARVLSLPYLVVVFPSCARVDAVCAGPELELEMVSLVCENTTLAVMATSKHTERRRFIQQPPVDCEW
jgi:hypothetical protein